jgi:hypothetical protein
MGGFSIYANNSGYFENKPKIDNIFELEAPFVEIIADHYSERMATQRSFFTLHRDPTQPFRHETMIKFNFPDEVRFSTLMELDFYGINKTSLFPGLEGIAAYWGWFYKISD